MTATTTARTNARRRLQRAIVANHTGNDPDGSALDRIDEALRALDLLRIDEWTSMVDTNGDRTTVEVWSPGADSPVASVVVAPGVLERRAC